MNIQIIVEDHVVPQLFTAAIEAYEIGDRINARRGVGVSGLETYGLLWGYALPARPETNQPERLVAVTATVETSAIRRQDSTSPSNKSIAMKQDFMRQYWPQLELIGTFHSHPYANLNEVKNNRGWRGSEIDDKGHGDKAHWPWFHEEFCPEMPTLAHLIVTICGLEKRGTAWPSRLSGAEAKTGYVLSADYRKLWIKAYASECFTEDDDLDEPLLEFTVTEDVVLDIPALQQRFV